MVALFGGQPSLLTVGCILIATNPPVLNFNAMPCSAAVVYGGVPALPVNPLSTYVVPIAGLAVTSGGTLVVANATTLYIGSDSPGASGGLNKFTQPAPGMNFSGPWTPTVWPSTSTVVKNPTASAAGVRGLAGRVEASSYVLYMTTSATAGGNALWRYDTAFDGSASIGAGYSAIATAPAGTAYFGVVVVPLPPPSPTPTASTTPTVSPVPTSTLTPTSSLSTGASPSTTASSSATPHATYSTTQTAFTSTLAAFNVPLGINNIVAVSTNGSIATLSEFTTTAAAPAVQTLALPRCGIPLAPHQGAASSALTGGYALFPCVDAYDATDSLRLAVRVAASGTVDMSTSFAADVTQAPRA